MSVLFGSHKRHANLAAAQIHMFFGHGLGSSPELHICRSNPSTLTSGFDPEVNASELASFMIDNSASATSLGVGTYVARKKTGRSIMNMGPGAASRRNHMHPQIVPAVLALKDAVAVGNTEELAAAIYTYVRDIAHLGVAGMLDPTRADFQRIMLTPPTRWAPAEEHAETRLQAIPRGAFKVQGVGIIGRSLRSPPPPIHIRNNTSPCTRSPHGYYRICAQVG